MFRSRLRILLTAALMLAALGTGVAHALSDTSAGGTPSEPTDVKYTPPSGPELTTEQVERIALSQAQESGEPNPSAITEANGTLERALRAMDPEMTAPQGPGGAAEMGSSAKLIVMHGEFTLTQARVPRGHTAPKGPVMSIVVDAHTGFVEGRYIGEEEPSTGELKATPIG